ncbi:unnamed protein product [Acanthoscelides obtectus]|uniref:Polynucleotide 5'-hydroxyl-kinase NOL9 n=1 Tax=Acanthoscelides obtectus TaxID=200917 RepID=A0A9P0KQ44_ACAOB|nr:unnamed protein product [Acanthoscelides obtectus]CAK1669264.1 Polynucleotide 5'-hydroxyl-kinase NOL9 [Acanthoscelides obtectus]
MDENYIDKLRQTIFRHRASSCTENKGGNKLSLECYKSENVFDLSSKQDSIKNKRHTPPSKARSEKRKVVSESSDDSFALASKGKSQSKKLNSKKKTKRKRCFQTFSSDTDEETMSLVPSRSETETSYVSATDKIKTSFEEDSHVVSSDSDAEGESLKPIKGQIKTDIYEISSDSDSEDFNLDTFFCTREQSITEPLDSHAEFDFISDYIRDVKISNKKVYDSNELKRKSRRNSYSSNKERRVKKSKEEFEIEVQKNIKPDVSSLSQNMADHFRSKKLKYKTDELAGKMISRSEKVQSDEEPDLVEEASSRFIDYIEIDDDDEYVEPAEDSTVDSGTLHDVLSENTIDVANSVPNSGFNTLMLENQIYSEESSHDAEDAEKHFQSVYEVRKPKADYYSMNDDKIIVLRRNSTLPFFGLFKLKVIYGKVDILGYTLNEQSQAVNVYSPRGSAWLYIKNVTDASSTNLNDFVSFLESNECLRKVSVEETSAVIQCSRLNENKICFIEKYISQQIFPDDISNKLPQVAFEPKTGNVINTHQKWDELIDQINPSTKFMVTGGKGVGKSTFVRYTINRLLGRFKKVRMVDLDPGQSMFTAPGMVSVLNVSEPVLGPSFTHLRQTERSYMSSIDVTRNPFIYVKAAKSLMDYVSKLDNDVPTVINYMGFVQNLGLHIISSIITYVKPTDVVQINSKQKKKNFKSRLNIDLIKDNYDVFGHDPIDFEFRLHELNALSDNSTGWTLEPRQLRELCVLAYLAELLPPNVFSLTSCHLPMYKVQLSTLKLMNLKCEQVSCAEVNANLVALCDKEEQTDLFICYGYGVVRGGDTSSHYVVLLTPVDPEYLEKVVYLVQGDVALPPSVYMTPDEVIGKVPYVMEGELVSLGQITRRSYLPAGKR